MPPDSSSMMYFSAKRPNNLTTSLGSTIAISGEISDDVVEKRHVDEDCVENRGAKAPARPRLRVNVISLIIYFDGAFESCVRLAFRACAV